MTKVIAIIGDASTYHPAGARDEHVYGDAAIDEVIEPRHQYDPGQGIGPKDREGNVLTALLDVDPVVQWALDEGTCDWGLGRLREEPRDRLAELPAGHEQSAGQKMVLLLSPREIGWVVTMDGYLVVEVSQAEYGRMWLQDHGYTRTAYLTGERSAEVWTKDAGLPRAG
jgi:hypothetical protein